MDELMKFAFSVPDFRSTGKGNYRHKLGDMLVLCVMAMASKCVTRAEIVEFGSHNLARLRSLGLLLNGVPSKATLCRVAHGIDENALASRMAAFADAFVSRLPPADDGEPDIVCIDGKAMKGTLLDNGRNPDIVSAYSVRAGVTLATEACEEKSNEIRAMPRLLERLDLAGKVVTADAMAMQKEIIDTVRRKGGDFIIELKANQRSLRYGIEDRIKHCTPVDTYIMDTSLDHGRIETRTYHTHDGLELIADKQKWGSGLTVVQFLSVSTKKSTGATTSEARLYVSSLRPDARVSGGVARGHWSIESFHWTLDRNLFQDKIKRKHANAARNLDTIQRVVHALFSMWRHLRKKLSDKAKGMAELMRTVSLSFTKLYRFLCQK